MSTKYVLVTLMLLIVTIAALGCTESKDTIVGTWYYSDENAPELNTFLSFYEDGMVVYSDESGMPYSASAYRSSDSEENTIIKYHGSDISRLTYEFTNDGLELESMLLEKVETKPVLNSEKIIGDWTISFLTEDEYDIDFYLTFYDNGI
ncbi:hypothetical protein J2755_001620 [Methanohalophilus levihalophilus]|uniref:hypothetical protein n=1 Tax=Methanohalophilus levihalophilus TaxID=1431282 RepID=UPI001AE72D84|nr:hypothetical protein [Methanohalophilus levihalophilus]MBP2030672.1 hypothetical protein [Methanohalophilus levihalophilus]